MAQDRARLERSCSFAGSLCNPEGPWLFAIFGLLGVTVIVPAIVLATNVSVSSGIYTGLWVTGAWLVGGRLACVMARRAVELEQARIGAFPLTVGPSYWALLTARPVIFYSQGSEGVVQNSIICRYVRMHLEVDPEAVAKVASQLEHVLDAETFVASDSSGQVTLTSKLRCTEHARAARDWVHQVANGPLASFGDDVFERHRQRSPGRESDVSAETC